MAKRALVVLLLFSGWSLGDAAIAGDRCPGTQGDGWVGASVGHCNHLKDGVPICTDFTGHAWIRASARARCAVAGGEFFEGPCPNVETHIVGSCFESLPMMEGFAEVHRVYAPQSREDFEKVCASFHGNECETQSPYGE